MLQSVLFIGVAIYLIRLIYRQVKYYKYANRSTEEVAESGNHYFHDLSTDGEWDARINDEFTKIMLSNMDDAVTEDKHKDNEDKDI